jgi:hypothetical protein
MTTNKQIAEELLSVLCNSENHNPALALKETLEKLQKLLSGEEFTYDWGNLEHTSWTDCLKQISAIVDELELL